MTVPVDTRELQIIAQQVLAARTAKGWSQKDLAEAAGVSQSSVANIENNKSVRMTTLHAVADAVGGEIINSTTISFSTPEPPREAEKAAKQLPPELDNMAARWLRIVPYLPPRLQNILLGEIGFWEETYGPKQQ